jgi:hypothetical protein
MTADGASSDAGARKASGTKADMAMAQADPAPQPKPIRLRYFGGPKSVMSAR